MIMLMIIIPVIIICLIYIIYIERKERSTLINIKMNNINEKINSILIKRKELIKDSEKVIKDIIQTKKQIYEGLSDSSSSDLSMIELDKKLASYVNEFYIIENRYNKLRNNEDFQKIYTSIGETEDLLNSYKEYYNNVLIEYNKINKNFSLKLFNKNKEKKFFDKRSINESYNNF